MAYMIPSSLDRIIDTTHGERKVFKLLKTKLPDICEVRYEVLLGEKDYRPDFTIIDPSRGVLIIEVKDWSIKSIVDATREQFNIQGYRGSTIPKPQLNPERKCEIYLRNTREQLVAFSILHNKSGRLIVPVEYFIAFPNITKIEFIENKFGELISIYNVLLKEDLVDTEDFFYKRYDELLPKLNTYLNKEQIEAITASLIPDIAIPRTMKPGFIKNKVGIVRADKQKFDTYNLSLVQEQIAKSLGEGPRLLRGIAGTGKTLIILYRAKLMIANDRTGQIKILILCWNISLANYMRQVYDKLQIDTQHNKPVIQHFAAFIRNFLNQTINYNDFFDDPNSLKVLEAVIIEQRNKYDAIYIDEAQDFRREWIAFLYNKLLKDDNPNQKNLIISADDAQRIYDRDFFNTNMDNKYLHQDGSFSWAELGIPIQGRSRILKTIYRNSARVWTFAAFLLEERASYIGESTEKVNFFSKGGYDPQLIACPNMKAQVDKTVDIIIAMIDSGYSLNNVLVIYRHKSFNGFQIIEYLQNQFYQKNIPYDWIAEDNQAKSIFEWESDTVKISTVHSAKGMDSPIVIILGAETFIQDLYKEQKIDEIKLMYVALTRARECLIVLYTGEGGLVHKLKYCKSQYQKYRDAIINNIEKIS